MPSGEFVKYGVFVSDFEFGIKARRGVSNFGWRKGFGREGKGVVEGRFDAAGCSQRVSRESLSAKSISPY